MEPEHHASIQVYGMFISFNTRPSLSHIEVKMFACRGHQYTLTWNKPRPARRNCV